MTKRSGDKISRLTSSIMVTIVLITASASSLPVGREHKPSRPDKSVLNEAVSEIEDAISRIKQYAQSLKSEATLTNKDDDEDPLAESIERESRSDDYRQEPELVPGLDRFEKNVDESGKARGKSQHPSVKPSNGSDGSDISLLDLLNFLREHSKDKKKEDENDSTKRNTR